MNILRNNPRSAALALLLLTLGFAALAAPAVVHRAAFVHALPFQDAARLVLLQGIFTHDGTTEDWGISHIDFLDWRGQNRVFTQMAAFSPAEMAFNLVVGKEAERLSGELVSYNYFALLGAAPALGRFFTPEEDGRPFTHPVTVLGHDLWQRRFGADPGILGRNVNLNGQPFTVVGVAPPGFRGLTDKAVAWIPSSMPPGPVFVSSRRMRWLAGVAPLRPGVTLAQAQADLDRITAALARQYPESNQGMGVRIAPLVNYWFAPGLRDGLRLLLWAGLAALLLAFVNLWSLLRLQARAAAEGTIAAGVVLALLGAGLGLVVASWAVYALVPASGINFPSFLHLTPDAAVAGGALAAALVGGVLVGWLARRGARAEMASSARGGARPGAGFRFAQGLSVVAQVGLALVAVAIAGLMIKGYGREVGQDLGFQRENVLVVRVDLQGPVYKTDQKVIDTVRRYLRQLSRIEGVGTLAIAGPTVPTDAWAGGYITIEDHDSDLPGGIYPIMTHSVTPRYFELLDIDLLQGRRFTMADAGEPGTPYNVIVSKAMAEQQWPGRSPLGERLKFSTRENPAHPWLTVVGVVEDVRHEGLLAPERPAPDLYLPILISPIRLPTTINFLVSPAPGTSTASLIPAIERAVRAVTPDSPTYDAATLQERLAKQTRKAELQVRLAEVLALLLLLSAGVAVYAAVAGGAVGVRGGLVLSGLGVALGLAGAVLLGRRLAGLLYGAGPGDPLILGAAAAIVLALAAAMSVWAARRRPPHDPASLPDRPALGDPAALGQLGNG